MSSDLFTHYDILDDIYNEATAYKLSVDSE